MSCLQNEMILESLFDEVWEEFRVSNKLTVEMMNELCSFSKGTVDNLEKLAQQRFEDLCQWVTPHNLKRTLLFALMIWI